MFLGCQEDCIGKLIHYWLLLNYEEGICEAMGLLKFCGGG